MSRVVSVSVCTVRVPLDRPTSFATRTVKVREYCLVKVHSAEGVDGIGFCYVGSNAGNLARVAVTDLLAPMLIGEESTRVEGLWEEMYREALGFKAVKIKVGRLVLAEEEERVRAALEAIGSEVRLMLDANNAWTDLQTALLYCERYEKYSPYWIEEPFSPDDIENHAKLAERISVPVATGRDRNWSLALQ